MLPADNGTRDPPMKGISSAIAAEWAKLPAANDFTAGAAALRAPFFTGTVPNIVNEHNAIFRLDHKINDKWDFMGRNQYSTSSVAPPTLQAPLSATPPGFPFD